MFIGMNNAVCAGSLANFFSDWDWKFSHVIPASVIPSSQTDLPVPIQGTIPNLHETGEVLKLPLRKSVSAFGRDDYGLYDYSYSSAKTSSVPHILTPQGSGYVDSDGYHSAAQADWGKVTYVTDLNFASADLTISFWTKPTGWISGWNNFMGKRVTGGTSGWIINSQQTTNQQFRLAANIGGTWRDPALQGTTTLVLDTWYHVAITRTGDIWRLFVNGVMEDKDTFSGVLYDWADDLGIMASCSDGNEGGGHGVMADLLILNGVALYYTDDSFTPPARGSMVLPQDLFLYNPHEVLNLPLTGHTTDLSYGTAKAAPETAQAPSVNSGTIGAGGLALTGGNYLAYPHSADFMNSTSDFYKRVEVTFNALPASSGGGAGTGQYMPLFDKGGNDQTLALLNNFYGESGIKFRMRDASNNTIIELQQTGAFDYSTGVRYTFDIIRNGSSATIKRNGVQIASYTITNANAHADADDTMRFGYNYDAAGGMVNLNATVHSILFLKGTSTAPASTYQHALQDLRFANGSTEVPYTVPLRGLNPISGQYDVWINEELSSTSDTELTAYIGNDEAEVATEITWPTAWKHISHRSGFAVDIISKYPLTISASPPSFDTDGLIMDGTAKYCELNYSRMADYTFAAGDYTMLLLMNPDTLAPAEQSLLNGGDVYNSGFYAETRSTGNFFFYHENYAPAFFGSYSGLITVGVTSLLSFRRAASLFKMFVNKAQLGSDYSNSTDVQPDAGLKIGHCLNNGTPFDGRVYAFVVIKGEAISDDQLTILDTALRTPASFQTVGNLESNVA